MSGGVVSLAGGGRRVCHGGSSTRRPRAGAEVALPEWDAVGDPLVAAARSGSTWNGQGPLSANACVKAGVQVELTICKLILQRLHDLA